MDAASSKPISYRATPWDERVFKVKTLELLAIDTGDMALAQHALAQLIDSPAPGLIYGRFDTNNQAVKKLLISHGFFIAEVAMSIFYPNLQKYETPALLTKKVLPLSQVVSQDHQQIINIAREAFHYSRFHEDPFIDSNLSCERMANWARDMLANQTPCLVYRNNDGEVISFLFYEHPAPAEVKLLLGGSAANKGMYSPYFWISFMEYFKTKQCKKVTTVISASNKGVMSLYLDLGFKVSSCNADYHLHLS